MTKEQLIELVNDLVKQPKESEWVEFKLNFHSEQEIGERISALANGSSILNQNEEVGLRNWLGSLIDLDLVIKTGKGKGTHYAVNPEFIRKINFKGKTNLKNIEDHRLEELIFKDIKAYPYSGFSEIHQRIGSEINQYKVKRMLKNMVNRGVLDTLGGTRGMKYQLKQKL